MRCWILLAVVLVACGDNGSARPDAAPDSPITGCTSNSGCNDNNGCTVDTCNASHVCENTPMTIDDSIACTTDACDPGTGNVTHTPVNAMCEQDGKTCTMATCSATTGCSETPTASVCDDGATCSTDACNPTGSGADPTTGCTYTLDNNACSDNFSCTTNTCTPTAVASDPTTGCLVVPDNAMCGDNITCTADACNPTGSGADTAGCTHQTMNALCEVDGKSCTVAACSATTGCSETAMDSLCNDNATCSTETCSPTGPGATGCVVVLNDAACTDTAECSTDACGPGMTGADPTSGCLHTADSSACSANAMCGTGFDCMCNAGFTGSGVTCTGIMCDALSNPANGTVTTSNGGLYPSTATYSCGTGFAPVPTATRTCNTDGTWSGSAPTCDPTFFVVRVGDGAAALSNASTAVFLEERDHAGTVLRTLTLPTAASGAQAALTLAGTSTTEGGLSRSTDGAYVTLAGYASVTGVAMISSSTSATVNRVVGRIASNGTIDTSTLVPAFSAGSVRGSCTVDGSAFWVSGTSSGTPASGGVQYTTFGSTAAPTQVFSTINNMRQCHVFGGQLYASTGSTTTGVSSIGTGTPTTSGQVATRLTTTASPNSFAVLDLNPVVAGADTIYVAADTTGTAGQVNVQKWTFDGTMWTQATFAPMSGTTTIVNVLGLTTWVDGTNVHIIVSTSESPARILMIIDDGATAMPAATVLGTAAANTAFRGVARSPTQ